MKRNQSEPGADESHVFDQTNGVVDLGAKKLEHTSAAGDRDRTVSGIAMLSTQKP